VMSVRNLILHNFWLKLFSIALATVLWLAIDNSIHNEQSLNQLLTADYIRVQVSVQTAPGDKRVFRITPNEVIVIAVGKDAASFQATRKDVRVNLDLTHFDAQASSTQELKAQAPPGITVLEIIPYTVQIQQVSP
jgi:AmiR/NasT family two-component response regulator